MNKIFILHFIAFILGSIPFGYLLGKAKGLDIREHGSGNIGATNVIRVVGKATGYLTLIADISKGLIAVMLAYLMPESTQIIPPEAFAASLGLFAIIGHCYSPFLKFNGGKGVATAFGVFLALTPIPTILAAGVFLISLKIFNYVSVSSLLASGSIPIFYYILGHSSGMVMTVAVIAACIIASRHKTNIYRIQKGIEPKAYCRP